MLMNVSSNNEIWTNSAGGSLRVESFREVNLQQNLEQKLGLFCWSLSSTLNFCKDC